jgi:hypothetical protein
MRQAHAYFSDRYRELPIFTDDVDFHSCVYRLIKWWVTARCMIRGYRY